MASFRLSLSRSVVSILLASVLSAQTTLVPKKTAEEALDTPIASDIPVKAGTREPVQSGSDRPPVLVPADSEEVTTMRLTT
jgi:hypothetical protein